LSKFNIPTVPTQNFDNPMKSLATRAVFLLSLALPAQAQFLDQHNEVGSLVFSQNFLFTAQSFVPTTHDISAWSVLLHSSATTNNGVFFYFYDEQPISSDINAHLYASQLMTVSMNAGETRWVDSEWGTPHAFTPGHTYYLGVMSYNFDWLGSDQDPYASGSASRVTNFGESYDDFGGNWDMGFRTYSTEVSTAPEPASLLLVASGLVGVVAISRRRRA
jgi:hypothetical protein